MTKKQLQEKLKEIMIKHFDEVLDNFAPKQPNGSLERKIGLVVGSTIIAKSIPEIISLIKKVSKR